MTIHYKMLNHWEWGKFLKQIPSLGQVLVMWNIIQTLHRNRLNKAVYFAVSPTRPNKKIALSCHFSLPIKV